MIAATVLSVMNEIRQCATFDHGLVRVLVSVAPDGRVTSTTLKTAPGDLGNCVANELKKVVFPPTKNGGTFTYPFNL